MSYFNNNAGPKHVHGEAVTMNIIMVRDWNEVIFIKPQHQLGAGLLMDYFPFIIFTFSYAYLTHPMILGLVQWARICNDYSDCSCTNNNLANHH